MKLSDKTYDFLKELSLTYLPILGSALIGLTNIWKWNIPAENIVASFSVIETALCGFLKISSATYYKERTEEEVIEDEHQISE